MTWFDRLSVRAAGREREFTRRTAVKTAAAGSLAASPLASSAVARAASQIQTHLRESACSCQKEAERRAARDINSAWRQFVGPHGKRLLIPNNFMFATAAFAGTLAAEQVNKIACGPCASNPSGSLAGGGGGSGGNCRERGGTCPPPGGGCPSGTTGCADGLCCFGSDICCACGADAQCCIVEVGCSCCG